MHDNEFRNIHCICHVWQVEMKEIFFSNIRRKMKRHQIKFSTFNGKTGTVFVL